MTALESTADRVSQGSITIAAPSVVNHARMLNNSPHTMDSKLLTMVHTLTLASASTVLRTEHGQQSALIAATADVNPPASRLRRDVARRAGRQGDIRSPKELLWTSGVFP